MKTTNHIDEIKLELFILNSPLVTTELAEIEDHLSECRQCKELYQNALDFYTEVKKDLTSGENLPMPRPSEIPATRHFPVGQGYKNLSPVRRFVVGVPLRMARWMVRHPYAAGGATLMFSSFIIAALVTMFQPAGKKPRDMNPTNVKFAGETMIVMNKMGEVVDTVLVGLQFAKSQSDKALNGNTTLVKFYDVDKDGINEIIWGQQQWKNTSGNSIIFCKSVLDNRLLWADTIRKTLSYVKQSVMDDRFQCVNLMVDDFDKDGEPDVISVAMHDFFPALISKINARDGRIISEYLHNGGISDIAAKDINDDGIIEILGCAIDNVYKTASLFVLDPRFITGHSPATDFYDVNNFETGREIFYLLIPKTIIGKLGKTKTGWNTPSAIVTFNDNKNMFRLCLDETITEGIAGYSIYFSYNLVPMNYETGDLFDLMAKRFVKENKIRSVPGPAYWESYTKEIKYWDGENWQNRPVQNRYYLQEVAKLRQHS